MRLLPPSCRNPSPPAAYNLANGCLFSLYSLYSLLFYLCSLIPFFYLLFLSFITFSSSASYFLSIFFSLNCCFPPSSQKKKVYRSSLTLIYFVPSVYLICSQGFCKNGMLFTFFRFEPYLHIFKQMQFFFSFVSIHIKWARR